MGKIMRLLIIEDSENDALLLLRELRKGGYQPEYKRVDTEIAMIEALEKDKWDIIISDYSMPQFNGIAALKISQKYKPDLPFIIVSGTIGEDVAVEAMKAGAHDYLMKGNLERLTPAIERELHDARIRREHKLSLIKLRQTEWIVESSHDMMALLNKDFVYLYANDAYLKAFGKTRDQLLGQSAPDVFGEVVFKTTIKPYADRCFEGKKARYQEWFDFPTLGHRYLDVAYTPYIGETNIVNEFFVIARDITEFKQTQEALQESKEKFHSMVDNIGIGVALISPEMEILELNRQMRVWFPNIDPSMRSICYRAFNDPPQDEICDYCPTCRTFQDGKVHESIIVTPTAVGPRNYRIASSPIFDKNGGVKSVIEMVDDITDRLSLETRLLQAQKMEAIGTLAGGIAHDFNNILSAVIGYAELLVMKIPKESDLQADLNEIYRAGNRAKELVKQILTFSRQKESERIRVQPSFIFKEAIKMLRSSIPAGIEIHQNIDPNAGTILADPTHLHQVIMNLCTNAYHAMSEESGILEISLTTAEIDSSEERISKDLRPGSYVKLTVSDTGAGITPQVRDRIFEPYFTTKEIGEGTGLGLSLVHGIVKTYGGAIVIESEPGVGSTFHVYFPRLKKAPAPVQEMEDMVPGGHERVLLADDESSIRTLAKRILEQKGYKVKVASDGVEALELFRASPDEFDLVVTDMGMPKMNGLQFSKELRKIRSETPIIICTGYSKQIDEETYRQIGINALLIKPMTKNALTKTVRKALDEAKG